MFEFFWVLGHQLWLLRPPACKVGRLKVSLKFFWEHSLFLSWKINTSVIRGFIFIIVAVYNHTMFNCRCLFVSQVTIYRIQCNLEFVKIKLLEIRSNNESKQSKENSSLSSTAEQPQNIQTEDSKVIFNWHLLDVLFIHSRM